LPKKVKLEASEDTNWAAIAWYEGRASPEDDFNYEDLWNEGGSDSDEDSGYDSSTESADVRVDDDQWELEEMNWDGMEFEFMNLERQEQRNWNQSRWVSIGLLETLKKFVEEDVEEGGWVYAGDIAEEIQF
jgi:hypothetical protein